MVLDKMAPICADFKCWGIQVSDHNKNPEHLQISLFLTIQKQDASQSVIGARWHIRMSSASYAADPSSNLGDG